MRYLIIFAKEPTDGEVKIRLSACLNEDQRIALYQCFLQDTLEMARRAPCQAIKIFYVAKNGPVLLQSLAGDAELREQKGEHPGERMHHAFSSVLRGSGDKCVLIGSDAPDLPVELIARAFSALEDHDVVLGPAADGGYYLVGSKEPCAQVFEGVVWGSAEVFNKTKQNVEALGKNVFVLDGWFDVDDPVSLGALMIRLQDSDRARWTRGFLEVGQRGDNTAHAFMK